MQDRTVFEDTVGQLREKLAKAEVRRCLAETFFFTLIVFHAQIN